MNIKEDLKKVLETAVKLLSAIEASEVKLHSAKKELEQSSSHVKLINTKELNLSLQNVINILKIFQKELRELDFEIPDIKDCNSDYFLEISINNIHNDLLIKNKIERYIEKLEDIDDIVLEVYNKLKNELKKY